MITRLEPASVHVPLGDSPALACGPCAERLRAGVLAVPGVHAARLVPTTGALSVSFDPAQVSAEIIAGEATQLVERLHREFGHRTYQVRGMDCADCARSIEQSVRALPGVVSVGVNFPAARMRVEYAPEATDLGQIPERARSLGFTAEEMGTGTAEPTGRRAPLAGHGRVVVSGLLLLLGLVLERGLGAPEPLARLALGASVICGGAGFARAGLGALRARIVGTNLLMALAAAGAVALGHWEEAATVVFLYALGQALEGAALERTRRSLQNLIEAAPATALVRRDGSREESVPAADLVPGDVLIIRPGAKLPADGIVASGTSAVSEAAITGESLPRDVAPGDAVYAGGVNGVGALLVRVSAPAADSTLARILHLVEEAQAQKAPAQALVERFGRVYTPLVIVAAVLLAVVGPLLLPGADWTYRALTLLVVACPCALVIATPVAFVSGIARAARGGVLVKGGAVLEALAGVRGVALDKTGTLTTGALGVTDIAALAASEADLLAIAAGAERRSEHPIARAVLAEAERRALAVPEAEAVVAVPGRGVAATIAGREALVGGPALLRERGVFLPDGIAAEAERLAAQGKTVLVIAHAGRALGALAVADAPRPEAAAAITALARLGLPATMLTGDNPAVAGQVGRTVGVADVRAGLLPEGKLAAIRALAARPGGAAFVGDGINDAPALAAATVGIAMGARGTAAALEAADIALMTDDLARLPWTVRLARATRAVVRQNVVIALGVVILLLLTTVSGALSLPVGVLGHEGSALLVILNGLRLLSPRLTRL